MHVRQPVIVIGAGRSGSTFFCDVLAKHPQLAWLSPLCSYMPDRPYLNRWFMQALDAPLLARMLQGVGPNECYPFWEHYNKGFSTPFRDLHAQDLTRKAERRLHEVLDTFVTPRRPRLMVKVTGWPRIGFFHALYPDAKFIHLVRDGRAVANSLLNQSWWQGWGGPAKWRWGALPPHKQAMWEEQDHSFVALAALQWTIILDAVERARAGLPEAQFLQVRYESFCDDPHAMCQQIIEWAELPWRTELGEGIEGFTFRNSNFKWQRDLTEPQQQTLNAVLAEYLPRYGYDPLASEASVAPAPL